MCIVIRLRIKLAISYFAMWITDMTNHPPQKKFDVIDTKIFFSDFLYAISHQLPIQFNWCSCYMRCHLPKSRKRMNKVPKFNSAADRSRSVSRCAGSPQLVATDDNNDQCQWLQTTLIQFVMFAQTWLVRIFFIKNRICCRISSQGVLD
jgi:hypothetical protein